MSIMSPADPRPSLHSSRSTTSMAKSSIEFDLPTHHLERRPLTPFSCISARNKHHRQRSASMSMAAGILPAEYDALPGPLQKKYFSQKERLHINQAAAAQKRQKSRSKDIPDCRRPSIDLMPRPKTSLGLRRRSSRVSLRGPRSEQGDVSEQDAQWFMGLPEKIQRQHFSREEQLKFTSRGCKPLDSAFMIPINSGPKTLQSGGGPDSPVVPLNTLKPPSTQPEGNVDKVTVFLDHGAAPPRAETSPQSEFISDQRFNRKGSATSTASSLHSHTTFSENQPPVPSIALPMLQLPRRKISTSRIKNLTPIKLPPPKLRPALKPSSMASPIIHRAGSSPALNYVSYDTNSEFQFPAPNSSLGLGIRSQPRDIPLPTKVFDNGFHFDFSPVHLDTRLATSLPATSSQQRRSSDFSGEEDDRSVGDLDPLTPTTVPDELDGMFRKSPSLDSDSITGGHSERKPSTCPSYESLCYQQDERPIHPCRNPLRFRPCDPTSSGDHLRCSPPSQASSHHLKPCDPLALAPLVISDDQTGAHGVFALQEQARSRGQPNSHHQHSNYQHHGLKKVWKNMKRF